MNHIDGCCKNQYAATGLSLAKIQMAAPWRLETGTGSEITSEGVNLAT